ncbi:MAG: hypoxanthine phosphoribosyltransferase [Pirellulaceae bacterium]|nr:MAG: hypoxanthine phosphoribosyltransferase [Pirellulaceae bacterium]
MAEAITLRFGSRPITIVGIMSGALVFLADLIRHLRMPVRISLIQASSYRGATQPGDLWIKDDMMLDIEDRDVLVVDDIFDTGKTLEAVVECLQSMRPASMLTAVLLYKEGRKSVAIEPDFAAFHIPDQFVVGYGLDYQDFYRNLPFVAVLEPEDLEKHTVSET